MRLRPMTQEEYVAYRARSEHDYAAEMAASGQLDLDAAVEAVRRGVRRAAARRPREPADAPVDRRDGGAGRGAGVGWIELRQRAPGVSAWVYDVKVDAARRGQGLGRGLMEALHEAARDLGATSISLNVFGHNTTAIHLYDSLGYAVTAQQMKRDL